MPETRAAPPVQQLRSRIIGVEQAAQPRHPLPAQGRNRVVEQGPAVFAAASATYQVVIVDADQKRRVTMALPATMLQSIAKDLGPWQR